MKIVHMITGLGNGGAENMLYKVLSRLDQNKYKIEVISMTSKGEIGPKIEDLGIKVHTLEMRRGIPTLSAIKKAVKILNGVDVLQTWMYHADLLGYICGKKAGVKKIIWGIRHNNLDKKKNKKLLIMVAKINKFLSKNVDCIVSCSKDATKVHIEFGYDKEKFVTIPNGFDIENYHRYEGAKVDILKELSLNDRDYKIVSHVARWDILKDYPTLIKCIANVISAKEDTIFLLCGKNIDNENKELIELMKENHISNRVYLLGSRQDIPKIMSASDVFVLSSIGEGFPNVIGEAMACETPCVVTNAGDSGYIVGNLGKVVKVGDFKSLSDSIIYFLDLPEDQLKIIGKKCRDRVINEFELNKIVKRYELLYE